MLFYSEELHYFFDEMSTIYLATSVPTIGLNEYLDVPCFLDMDVNHSRPASLILPGSVPPAGHITQLSQHQMYNKYRSGVVTFVLNPSGEEEIAH